ncbi:MAG: ThiF family adenylyltransferase [Candidatus Omnitrophica bacterium]|nr:ThiF family adenylyltransferase [Candidatus Omnitrophota bacterium]MCK5259691.1 ThiF family adenylyltransferase [Candidatus Omnitrophota bacterium]
MTLNKEQLERYSRQIVLNDVGVEGQEKITEGKVLVIGAGGLGSSAILHLAAAGAGTIGLVDDDVVDLSNLQRQIIHFTMDIGKQKVLSAKEKVAQINPDVNVVTYQEKVSAGNIIDIIKARDYDFIIDTTDNFPSKFLINDASVLIQKPFSHGGVLRFDGQVMTYVPGEACYRCIFGYAPPADVMPKPAEAGVFGAVPGILGTIQAAEALKYLAGSRDLLVNRLLIFNALSMEFRSVKVKKDPQCPVCSDNPKIKKLEETIQNV